MRSRSCLVLRVYPDSPIPSFVSLPCMVFSLLRVSIGLGGGFNMGSVTRLKFCPFSYFRSTPPPTLSSPPPVIHTTFLRKYSPPFPAAFVAIVGILTRLTAVIFDHCYPMPVPTGSTSDSITETDKQETLVS